MIHLFRLIGREGSFRVTDVRYQRNVKIFRGGVDAAPFAGLFFVVVLFMMLFYSHVFFPGVPIKLDAVEIPPEMTARSVKILNSGRIEFLGDSYDLTGLKQELQRRSQKGTLPRRVLLESDLGVKETRVTEIENLIKDAGIGLKLPGTRLDLPEDAGFAGAHNPLVVVGVNLNGQIFFEHQKIDDGGLEQQLKSARERAGDELTLVLQADKKVPYETITRLSQIARRAGILYMRLATKPGV
jgi:biopolymer transport protein ExbD